MFGLMIYTSGAAACKITCILMLSYKNTIDEN